MLDLQEQGLRCPVPFPQNADHTGGPVTQTQRQTMTPGDSLVQIRTVYQSEWRDLAFSVESGCDEWTIRVEDSATRRLLYTARRGCVSAAQVAAAEYGISHILGFSAPLTPARLAADLPWRKHY